MNNTFLRAGALLGLLAVALGAFGAHALKDFLQTGNHMATYETAVSYQFYHALVLLFTGILAKEFPNKRIRNAGFFFLSGIIIFSSSLYLICFTGISKFGAIAPIGGSLLILGWLFLLLSFTYKK